MSMFNLFFFLLYRKSLEEVITADEIRGMRDLKMARFESEVWEKLGRKNISQEDRRMVCVICFIRD